MTKKNNYSYSVTLIFSILVGSALGLIFKERFAVHMKPFGDIFLNLLFTVVVPMVFFSISSAIAVMKDLHRLGRILGWMILIFVVTGIISSCIMAAGVILFPPASGLNIGLAAHFEPGKMKVAEQLVGTFTTGDFIDILSKKNMLALIIMSMLVGIAASAGGEKGRDFTRFLVSGNEVMSKVISYIMLYAPVGLGAYFAYLVGMFGSKLLGSYFKAIALYYPVSILYFIIAFTFYAFLAGRSEGVKKFWSNILPTSLTAWGTGSSVATIPVNLEAARDIGVPEDIREVVIPIGATIHMDGSCLAAILKIAVLFGIFNMDFMTPAAIITAVGVAILSGTVISGIPAGGILGELLIVTLYGFPVEAIPIISMIGTLVDPPATMVNAVGDNVASMMVSRIMCGKKWMSKG